MAQLKSSLSANKRRKLKFSNVLVIAFAAPMMVALFVVLLSINLHRNTMIVKDSEQLSYMSEETQQLLQATDPTANKNNNNENSSIGRDMKYHIVFSTGCSIFQDWQSYVFFYHALKSKQPGIITRIVSGCKPEEQEELQTVFNEQIASLVDDGRFRLHFTPDYSLIKPSAGSYKYFNKPFGMLHWLTNELGFPNNASKADYDSIVVLMDPDQIIMRPFRNNDFSNTAWQFLEKDEVPQTMVDHGKPMGQQYGFGLQWKNSINMTDFSLFGLDKPSPVSSMSFKDARRGYIVGPPYIATGNDMFKIVSKWTQFAIPVHDQYGHLLAEMFAYCISAAHQLLSHQTAGSFMVSDMHANRDEGWSYIDKLNKDNVCRHPNDFDPEQLPNVLHFCQRYGLGDYFFGKYRLPKNFLTCDSPLLAEPPMDFVSDVTTTRFPDGVTKNYNEKETIRNAFMVCYMIFSMNEAATHWKQRHCEPGKANMTKAIDYKEVGAS
jgi:hypothetical protein